MNKKNYVVNKYDLHLCCELIYYSRKQGSRACLKDMVARTYLEFDLVEDLD